MNYVKHLGNVAKTIAGGAIVPGVSDAVNRLVDNMTGEVASDEEMRRIAQEEINSGKRMPGMKKGGKVRSASQRADGCAIRGKTRA